MTLDELIVDTLKGLVANRVFPDLAPPKTAAPFITYTAYGGQAVNFLGGEQSSKRNALVQVTTWGERRLQVSALAAEAEAALRTRLELGTTVLSQPQSLHDPETGYRGAAQDFSFWTDTT
jgi:hypothetical protein